MITSRLSRRARAWIDVFGCVFFLMPMALAILWLSWPMFTDSYMRHEISGDAGGLLRWPVKLLVPAGFLLLALQGASELIKRAAFLMGLIPEPPEQHSPPMEPGNAHSAEAIR